MGKTRDLFKKIRDTKGTFHAKMGTIKDRNCMALTAGVQPQWIQGDSKVGGRSRRLWKNTYLITDIERLEMDSVVGRLVEKKRLNNLDYVE